MTILIKCECGSEISKKSLSRHLKTKKHINFINQLEEESVLSGTSSEDFDIEEIGETSSEDSEEYNIEDLETVDEIIDKTIEEATKKKMSVYDKLYMETLPKDKKAEFKRLFKE